MPGASILGGRLADNLLMPRGRHADTVQIAEMLVQGTWTPC